MWHPQHIFSLSWDSNLDRSNRCYDKIWSLDCKMSVCRVLDKLWNEKWFMIDNDFGDLFFSHLQKTVSDSCTSNHVIPFIDDSKYSYFHI